MKNTGKYGEDKVSLVYSENHLKNRVLVLASINVLQPVTKRNLVKSLEEINNEETSNIVEDIEVILDELNDAGFIKKERGWYRTTYKGISLFTSKKAKQIRDTQRIFYLLETSKQRGGDLAGR